MRKHIILPVLLSMMILLLFVSCSSNAQRASELLSLGEKYLLELNYEQAIVQLLTVIEIDPKKERAYILLADAYKQSGEQGKGQAILEMGFAILSESDAILENLINSMIKNDNAEAISRLVADVQRIGNLGKGGFEKSIHDLANSDNNEFVDRLINVLYTQDNNSALALSLELWVISNRVYDNEEERNIAISKLLTDREKAIPKLNPGDQFYLGGYDENGNRQGFGISFYGEGIKLDSTMYIGNWDNNVRTGEGTAYNGVYYYIMGNWTDDLPNGIMTSRYSRDMTSEGLYNYNVPKKQDTILKNQVTLI